MKLKTSITFNEEDSAKLFALSRRHGLKKSLLIKMATKNLLNFIDTYGAWPPQFDMVPPGRAKYMPRRGEGL